MWGEGIELGTFDRYVLVPWRARIEFWLARGFLQVPEERLLPSICGALDSLAPYACKDVWNRLFPHTPLLIGDRSEVLWELMRAARGPLAKLIVLERVAELGVRRFEQPKFEPPPLPPRTQTDHYVVIEAVSDAASPTPVAGLRLELLIADGEIRSAQTDANGVARVERIQAGRVVIRVLGLDGALWRPTEGAASQPSGSNDRARVHVVKQGDCLSKIAHRYGMGSWKKVWDDPSNARLRKKRKSPHVLLPADEVTVPGITVHEIVRATDATHRIEVSRGLATFQVVLQDHNQQPFQNEPYELRTREEEDPRYGVTGSDGRITERLSVHVVHVEVRLPGPGLSWSFALSQLIAAPASEAEQKDDDGEPSRHAVMAAQARLNALGLPCGAVDGLLGPRTRAALALQRENDAGQRDPNGELASATLQELHDMFLA